MKEVGSLNLAGGELLSALAGFWWAGRDTQSRESQMPERTRNVWQEPFGDRRQSFAIMATEMDHATLQRQLDDCLLTDEEMALGEQGWSAFPDPFPSWAAHSHIHHHHDDECDHDHGSPEHD